MQSELVTKSGPRDVLLLLAVNIIVDLAAAQVSLQLGITGIKIKV